MIQTWQDSGENTGLSKKRWCFSQGPKIRTQCKKMKIMLLRLCKDSIWKQKIEDVYQWICVGISASHKHMLNSSSDNNVYWYSCFSIKYHSFLLFQFPLLQKSETHWIWSTDFITRRKKKYFDLGHDGLQIIACSNKVPLCWSRILSFSVFKTQVFVVVSFPHVLYTEDLSEKKLKEMLK